MKKMLIGAMALSLAASAAAAQPYGHGPDRQGPPGQMQGDGGRHYDERGRDHDERGRRHDERGRDDRGDHRQAPKWGREYGANHHWRRGQRMGYNDWRSARAVDYRQHRLRRPPQGYEWRETNGQYVLGAVATGLIASIILNGR